MSIGRHGTQMFDICVTSARSKAESWFYVMFGASHNSKKNNRYGVLIFQSISQNYSKVLQIGYLVVLIFLIYNFCRFRAQGRQETALYDLLIMCS